MTLLVAQREQLGSQLLWNLYYHLLLDEESAQVLRKHLVGLLAASASLKDWRESEFGGKFRFGNTSTLFSVRDIWHAYAESLEKKDQNQYRRDFETVLKHSKTFKNAITRGGALYMAALSASPLGMVSSDQIKIAMDSWWEKGTIGLVPDNTNIPNPLFALTLSKHCLLPYSADPILSYHLATAYAHLTENSVVHSENQDGIPSPLAFVAAAQKQFSEWSQALVDMASRETTWRFIAADGLSFCHTLQHHLETGQLSGQIYRRQLTMERLELDPDEYGQQSKAPKQFDVIDTSDLEDSLGGLNILTSASPLLKRVPWAALYTESKIGGKEGEKPKFKELLSGPTRTVATLFGLSPVEYWTNATAVSNVEEYLLNVNMAQPESERPGINWRFAWKFHGHLSGQTGQVMRLKVKDDDLVNLIYKVYRTLFVSEDMMAFLSLSKDRQTSMLLKHAYPKYHRGSLVAVIRRLLQTVDASQEAVCRGVLTEITEDSSLMMGAMFSQALSLEMSRQGLFALSGVRQDIQPGSTSLFSNWSKIPDAVAVTISIPAVHWKRFANAALEGNIGFTVEGGIRGVQGGKSMWDHIFSDVQVTFGTVSTTGDHQSEDFTVTVDEDAASWSGNSDMVATFSVPTAALLKDPRRTKASLRLHSGVVQVSYFKKKLQLGDPEREPMTIFETDLEDDGRVHVSKNQPGVNGFAIYSSLRSEVTQGATEDCRSSFTANIDESGGITTITGRLDVMTPNGKKLLTDKASVDARKVSPFIFEIVVGEQEALYQLCFPVPVVKDGSVTRVARTSAYIEIMAHVADPVTSQALDDFIFPSTLAKAGLTPSLGYNIPVPLNIPHVNLDNLPVLDVANIRHPKFLTTLTSWTFSARERKVRDQANSSGLAASARMNFKESIFTMFMLASGLQGGQTGLFAIHHPEKGGIHMLLFVSAIRMHGANATVALDAAVIPFTADIIKGGKLEAFLLILRELECCTITVNDEELVLWKKVLPALAERCRNWSHTPECEYTRPDATIPLSTEMGKQVLCSCGAGKLPEDFLSLPEWDVAAQFATRIAISPTYAVPFVEDVIDPDIADSMSRTHMSVMGDQTLRCMNCGALEAKGGGPLKKCSRCLKVRYCSAECQKKDWKKHRMECGEAAGK